MCHYGFGKDELCHTNDDDCSFLPGSVIIYVLSCGNSLDGFGCGCDICYEDRYLIS